MKIKYKKNGKLTECFYEHVKSYRGRHYKDHHAACCGIMFWEYGSNKLQGVIDKAFDELLKTGKCSCRGRTYELIEFN